jgi:uncharacterized protein
MPIFDIEPRVNGDIYFGDYRREAVILAGRTAEKGVAGQVFFDGSDNFVVLEVGKRGSGKSYGMGAFLEGFATSADNGGISRHKERRGVLLLDPLDIHWTALLPLAGGGPRGLQRQFDVLRKWPGLTVESIRARAWVPAGFRWDIDHPDFREYFLPVSVLEAGDWALLLSTDLILEPRGRLIAEAHEKVTALGWRSGANRIAARSDYSIQDLIQCIERDDAIQQFYHAETIRSVVQPLLAFARMPLFSARHGTPMIELVEAGTLSILSLGRLSDDLRTVVAAVVVRKLYQDRAVASQIRRRLELQRLDDDEKQRLESELVRHVPRTVLGLDEAQILMPAKAGDLARSVLDSYVLQGRNFGLSLWLATQRPKGAISDAAVSQIDTFIIHRLSVADDIVEVCRLLQSARPDKIRLQGREIDLAEMIRSLDIGQAVISSASGDAPRLVTVTLRPRMVAHGGEAF